MPSSSHTMPLSKMDDTLFEERLNAFNPEPLIKHERNTTKSKKDIEMPWIRPDGNKIDLAKTNFLNVLNNEDIKRNAEKIIRKYGVGTCGPRAFYGTTDLHVQLEEQIATFFGTDEAIVYSNGYMAIASAIAAYCRRNDVIFTHADCNIAIKQGIQMARSKIFYFDHQNLQSFAEQIAKVKEMENDHKHVQRKFLIVEGVSWKTGKLLKLPDFIKLAEENKIRIFLEESYAIGVYGRRGRGLLEYFDIEPFKVDLIISKLETAIGSNGGFCAGSHLAIEHQRLSGSGYIFSASLPTYLVNACIESFKLISEDLIDDIQTLTADFHDGLLKLGYNVQSHQLSAMKVFNVKEDNDNLRRIKESKVAKYCSDNGIYLILEEYGLIVNLNVALLRDSEKYDKIKQVLRNAIQ